jgi:hypothetical protein
MPVKILNNTQRLIEIGRTGTGKTVAGLYWLSQCDLSKPWVVFNFKDDEHIESIANTRYISYDYVPQKRDEGLFIIDVRPGDTKGKSGNLSPLENYFTKLWERQNVGIFVDEAFMIGSNDAFDMCLTQGRSRRIPMIVCTQKPSWISTFCYSEASFFQVFDLNDVKDIDRIEQFLPFDWFEEEPLDDHESWYYDVSADELVRLKPVPPMEKIREIFSTKLRPQRVRI